MTGLLPHVRALSHCPPPLSEPPLSSRQCPVGPRGHLLPIHLGPPHASQPCQERPGALEAWPSLVLESASSGHLIFPGACRGTLPLRGSRPPPPQPCQSLQGFSGETSSTLLTQAMGNKVYQRGRQGSSLEAGTGWQGTWLLLRCHSAGRPWGLCQPRPPCPLALREALILAGLPAVLGSFSCFSALCPPSLITPLPRRCLSPEVLSVVAYSFKFPGEPSRTGRVEKGRIGGI